MLLEIEPVPVALFASLIKGDLYRAYKEVYGEFPLTGTATYIMALHVWHGVKTSTEARARLRGKLVKWKDEIEFIQSAVLPSMNNFKEDQRMVNSVYITCIQAVLGYMDTLDTTE